MGRKPEFDSQKTLNTRNRITLNPCNLSPEPQHPSTQRPRSLNPETLETRLVPGHFGSWRNWSGSASNDRLQGLESRGCQALPAYAAWRIEDQARSGSLRIFNVWAYCSG